MGCRGSQVSARHLKGNRRLLGQGTPPTFLKAGVSVTNDLKTWNSSGTPWSSSSVRGNAAAHRDAAGSGGIAEAVATEQIGL